jgi:hypothetical protein
MIFCVEKKKIPPPYVITGLDPVISKAVTNWLVSVISRGAG